MKLEAANKLIDNIINEAQKDFKVESVIDQLKELREFALKEEDPTVTKVLRLCYEYLGEHGVVDFTVETEEDEEGEEIQLENEEDIENFLYFMGLVRKSDNKYNREELQRFRDEFKADLY